MIQETVLRAAQVTSEPPVVLCHEDHRFMIAQQMQEIGMKVQIVLEPQPRDTAPAATIAACLIQERDPDAIVFLLPADHMIRDVPAFVATSGRAIGAAAAGDIVTFGMKATEPNTGYGYIRPTRETPSGEGVYRVRAFVEKPDVETARLYLRDGYLWNSGMFVFRADVFLDEVKAHAPEILDAARRSLSARILDRDFVRLDGDAFASAPKISVDHAVMERTERMSVIPADIGWSDVGSWSSLWQTGEADGDGNVTLGDVVMRDARNCYARSEKGLIALVGTDDLIVVATEDAILVADRNHAQEVKQLVDSLKADARIEFSAHKQVYRPWGDYRTIDSGDRFQVKQITVKPGGSLSLQFHHHRAEHWVVVEGTARVTRGEEVCMLKENESTYIPRGTVHRLENPGDTPLRIIEVQSGSYLGEDDIVRLDDIYGRRS
jgi:mannose-1-phosphate guanylyltransferase/mannose-1-phosphate guanylyltransferase/mannose-6-phosphate isomerase